MGICASCLGYGRRDSGSEVDTQHLLSDPYQPQYGTSNQDNRHGTQIDPEEIRRQRDVLERLCAQTSDKLIDVTQPALPSSSSVQNPNAKASSDYPQLFAERFGPAVTVTSPRTRRQADYNEYEVDHSVSSKASSELEPSSAEARREERERLKQLLSEGGKDGLQWKRAVEPGALSITFDDVLRG